MVEKQNPKIDQKRMQESKPKMSPTVLRPSPGSKEDMEQNARAREHYNEVINRSDGFDVCRLPTPTRFRGLREHICNTRNPCPSLVLLYARLGLQRYNVLQGKNLQLIRVKKYNRSTHTLACSYYITLEAKDPDFDDSILIFQTKVSEKGYKKLYLFCDIARLLGEKETKKFNIPELNICTTNPDFCISDLLPELPTENPFKQFYVLKKSEFQDNNECIRLYLDLAVGITNRISSTKDYDLSNLKILKVAIQNNIQDDPKPKEGLICAYDATFYIRYLDTCKGKDVDHIAIVRRVLLQEETFIVGWTQNTDTIIIPKNDEERKKSKTMSNGDL